jgi:hypothetical protein
MLCLTVWARWALNSPFRRHLARAARTTYPPRCIGTAGSMDRRIGYPTLPRLHSAHPAITR